MKWGKEVFAVSIISYLRSDSFIDLSSLAGEFAELLLPS